MQTRRISLNSIIGPVTLVALVLTLVGLPAAHGAGLAIPTGQLDYSPAHSSFIEQFEVPPALHRALLDAEVGDEVVITEFPVEPGVRMAVSLRRVEPYAEGARVIVFDGTSEREVPRSTNLFFRGEAMLDPHVRVGLTIAPDTGKFHGIVRSHGTSHVIAEPADGAKRYTMATADAMLAPGSPNLVYQCGADHLPADSSADDHPQQMSMPPVAKNVTADPQYSAVIAFDSDNEWNYYRFANNTTDAANWLADYVNQSNVMYERDLSMRLLIGDTFFRLDTDPSPTFDDDPYTVLASPANSAMLSEFGNYWSANYGAIDRVLAQLLSGKSSSDFSSSGIAWLDGYCEYQSTGGGYSIFEPFKSSGVPVSSSLRVGAHELGHNFSSPHTHCYSPVVDECYSGESGCYSGSVSCPGGGNGTMMSYCHFNPPNCGSNLVEFHSRVITYIDGYRAAHTPWCVKEFSVDEIFADGFEGGDTSMWSVTVP